MPLPFKIRGIVFGRNVPVFWVLDVVANSQGPAELDSFLQGIEVGQLASCLSAAEGIVAKGPSHVVGFIDGLSLELDCPGAASLQLWGALHVVVVWDENSDVSLSKLDRRVEDQISVADGGHVVCSDDVWLDITDS